MGFLDRFGVGGGKLEVHPSSSQVTPGSTLSGTVAFVSGSRAQQITHIKAKLTQNLVQTTNTPQGPQQRHETHTIGPEVVASNAFTSQPGQRYDFQFQIQLPPSLPNSVPGHATYRLAISADIDGEIDPGSGFDIQVVGGTSPQQQQWGAQPA